MRQILVERGVRRLVYKKSESLWHCILKPLVLILLMMLHAVTYVWQERMIKLGGARACNFRRFWTGQNNPPVLFIEHSFAREILIAWYDPCACEYVYTCHILATTGSFGCASSIAVSEVLQGHSNWC